MYCIIVAELIVDKILVTLTYCSRPPPFKAVKINRFGPVSSEPVGGFNQTCIDTLF